MTDHDLIVPEPTPEAEQLAHSLHALCRLRWTFTPGDTNLTPYLDVLMALAWVSGAIIACDEGSLTQELFSIMLQDTIEKQRLLQTPATGKG
jgi:hypothetical protein